tara:strand:+ start:2138 stop:3181 length:1044 start_codon:yes stop_codon:yes gene_type:complete
MRARQFWNIKNWHWVSSAICLAGMLLFAVTGITLNHPTVFEGDADLISIEAQVPPAIMAGLHADRPISQAFRQWYQTTTGNILPETLNAQWSEFEMYVSLPRAGGDRWFSVDRELHTFYQETTDRGWIAYLNDLHKGRNTHVLWTLFIDVFAIASVLFSVTGLLLLKKYAKGRKTTWPLVAAGIVVPILLLLPNHASANELSVQLPRLTVSEYHPPYLAVWLMDAERKKVADVAIWYDTQLADHEGEKWLKDMRLWWRRSGRFLTMPVDGVSGATRQPGKHRIDLTALVNMIRARAPQSYTLYVEAARELGGREVLQFSFEWPLNQPFKQTEQGRHELATVQLTLEP